MKRNLLPFFFLTILLFSCKKEQPDLHNGLADCSCGNEVNAAFSMEEKTTNGNSTRYTDTDSIFASKNVRFYAVEADAFSSTTTNGYPGKEVVISVEKK